MRCHTQHSSRLALHPHEPVSEHSFLKAEAGQSVLNTTLEKRHVLDDADGCPRHFAVSQIPDLPATKPTLSSTTIGWRVWMLQPR
jgi:hypothetical protein